MKKTYSATSTFGNGQTFTRKSERGYQFACVMFYTYGGEHFHEASFHGTQDAAQKAAASRMNLCKAALENARRLGFHASVTEETKAQALRDMQERIDSFRWTVAPAVESN